MTAPALPEGTILGYPRIGRRRELKRAVESHWAGALSEADLEATTADLRRATFVDMHNNKITELPPHLFQNVTLLDSFFFYNNSIIQC